MRSATVCTWSLDNPVLAAKELKDQITKQLVLQKNSVGIIFGDADMDYSVIHTELKKSFDFEIFGCTSMGMLGIGEGYEEFCITLLVLTADDCFFHLECTDPITKATASTAISAAFDKGVEAIGKPKLVVTLAPLVQDVFLDIYPELIGELSNSVPIFGGISSASVSGNEFVLHDGNAYKDRAVFLFINGNIRPKFCTCNLFDNIVEQKRTITKAEENIIYRVGDQTFLEYADSLGLSFNCDDPDIRSFAFVSHPLLIEENSAGSDGLPFVRTIGDINPDEGYVVALGKVPEGALMSIGVLRKEEIKRSAEIGLSQMRELFNNDDSDYEYSTLFSISCLGRNMVMAPNIDLEGKLIQAAFGSELQISGFYAWGEMCPTSYDGESASNRGHHETLSLCAF